MLFQQFWHPLAMFTVAKLTLYGHTTTRLPPLLLRLPQVQQANNEYFLLLPSRIASSSRAKRVWKLWNTFFAHKNFHLNFTISKTSLNGQGGYKLLNYYITHE